MSTITESGNPPKPIQDIWQEKKKAFLDAINDRVRTMSLGSLVLIWGLFIGEAHKEFPMNKGPRILLLLIALGAVSTLLLEYVEQWTGYLGAKQALPGSKVKPFGFPYIVVSKRAFHIKHLLAIGTIITLLIVLGCVLFQTAVYAQTSKEIEPYKGHWLGVDGGGNNYMELRIEYESNEALVWFNWKDQKPTRCLIKEVDSDIEIASRTIFMQRG